MTFPWPHIDSYPFPDLHISNENIFDWISALKILKKKIKKQFRMGKPIYKSSESKISFHICLVLLFSYLVSNFILTRTLCSVKGVIVIPLYKENWVTKKLNAWDDPAIQKQPSMEPRPDLRHNFFPSRPCFLQIPYFWALVA